MNAYLDSSVLLRVLFAEPGRLAEWPLLRRGVASELAEVEALRTIDRLRLRAGLSDDEVALRIDGLREIIAHLEVIPLVPAVLKRAAQPFPTSLGTLDALHLASALAWQQSEGLELDALATHDLELGRAARAVGLTVVGCA